jgi:carboxylesterase
VDSVILDDSYHMVTLDQQRHIVAERSVEFVARVEAMARGAEASGSMKGARAD